MDFHGMNRKNLQILCKKHEIPANLKNIEMANRLASLFQKEVEETVTETKVSPEEDSVEADDVINEEEEEEEANLVASRKAKKVRFSPETDNQVFEFTRSVKKNVRTRRRRQDGAAKALQQDGSRELRRSKRSVSKGIGSNGEVSYSMSGIVEAEKEPSNSVKVTRRSKRIGSSGSAQEEGEDTDLIAPEQLEDKDIKGGGRRSTRLAAGIEKSCVEGGTSKSVTLLPAAKRSKRVVDVANKEHEKVTEESNREDGDSKVEMVRRRSMRFVNEETNTQDQRRSVRLKASVANSLMGQATSKLKNDTVTAARVVKGNLVDKKEDENLVKSSKRVTRNMKRGRSGEPGVDSGTASNQSTLTPKKTLDEFAHFEQKEACGAHVKARGSSKKSKTTNQECIKDKPQGIVITAESVEKVFDPTLDKSVDSPQRPNSQDLKCESMEGECEEKLERDTVSMPVMEDIEEVSSRSLSSPKDKLHVPTGHIIVKDSASTVIAEESTKTKDETIIYAPESELKEHSSIAKLANIEEILENSTECWNEIHSSKDDEKGSFEKDVQAENLHGNVSECNTENSSAEEEMEISKIVGMSAGDCVNLTSEEILGEYAHLEREEAERPNVGARSSSQKMKIVGQEFVNDKPQGMAEDSPSTSETKATEPVVVSENVLDSTRTVSGDTSAVRNSQELDSELLEEKAEEKHEQPTLLLAATKKDKGEASSLSEVKTCPDNRNTSCSLSVETTLSPVSVQLAVSNPEADLCVPTGNDIVSTVITEEDKITKEETLILTPTSELQEGSSVAELSKVEAILENSAECCKEEEKGSLKKDVQAENLHVNFSEGNTENSSSEEEMEIRKDSCMSVNLTPEKLLDKYTQLVPEEAGGSKVEIRSSAKKMKTVSSEFLKENPQGMVEAPSTFETRTTETIMMSENVSVDISPVGNIQESNPERTDEEREEKQELDIVLVAETEKKKKKASSPSECLTERPEVSLPESEPFMETTPPPSVQLAASNPESKLRVPTGHILARDIVSAVIVEENNKTEEVPKSVHSFVAKLAETDAFLETSAECWNESLSSKDDERGKHGIFSEYNAANSCAEEQADICKVGRIGAGHCVDQETLDEVKDESLMKSVQTISIERGCKPNTLELSRLLSTDFASLSRKEDNFSECLEEDEMKGISQPTPVNKASSNALDRSSVFTTPERNLMLMEKLSESGKICAAEIVTQNNDETVESHAVVFTTPEQVLLLGDSGLNEVGKEDEQTTTCFPDESAVLNTSHNEGERIVVELHGESNIAASPLRQSSVGDFKEERTERKEENRTVELHCESGTCTGPDKHAALVNSASGGAENSRGNKAIELYVESVAFTGLEERPELFGDSGKDKARDDEVKMDAQFYEEAGLSTEMHKDLHLADLELGEAGWLGTNNNDKSGSLEGQLLYGDSVQKKAENPAEKAAAEFHDMSIVPNFPERHPFSEEFELEEVTKSEENNALVTGKSHDMSDVYAASESHSLMGDFKPDEEENKDVELLGESNISTDVERHLLSEESELDETKKIKYNTAATCEESFVFISPERQQQLGNSEPHTAGNQERKEVEFKDESAFFTRLETRILLGESGQDGLDNGESGSTMCQSHHASSPKVIMKDDSVARESHVAAPDFRENTFSGSIASKVSYNHEFSVGEEAACQEFMPKASQAEHVVDLDAIQGTSKQSRGSSPNVDQFYFDTKGTETIMDAYVLALPAEGNSKITVEISNHVEVARTCSLVSEESDPFTDIPNQIHDALEELAITDELIDAKVTNNTPSDTKTISLPAEVDSETIGEISSQLEVAGTCSMVSESSPSIDIQNHLNDALEELAVTDNNEEDELTEAKVTKNVDSSGGTDVFRMASVLAGTEDDHLCYNSEVTNQVDTPFEKDISLTPDESTLQKNRNEEAAADPSPEETLKGSSEKMGESGTSSEKQVRREPVLIYRTQVKPKRHDMKENAPNSKIVDTLNVTAPRTSKRRPLQDLRKN